MGNRSSEFHPDVRRVRREGSYIYEEFMPTGGTDVKVRYLSQVPLSTDMWFKFHKAAKFHFCDFDHSLKLDLSFTSFLSTDIFPLRI